MQPSLSFVRVTITVLATALVGVLITAVPTAAADPVLATIALQDETTLEGGGASAYDPAGRRDPFVDPRASWIDSGEPRPEGIAGTSIDEVRLIGLSRVAGDPIALLQSRDGRGHAVRSGQTLWDGSVATIDFDAGQVVFRQRVTDPTVTVRYREVVRLLDP